MRLEIILLIGPPACGKSTIARRLESSGNCVRINQDTLKTRPACLKAARSVLTSGKSVIVDNTNSNQTQRSDWIKLAQSIGGVVSYFNSIFSSIQFYIFIYLFAHLFL